ncbi:MAG: hypothetical protein ACRC5T_05845 [Cetobacterium sp.]
MTLKGEIKDYLINRLFEDLLEARGRVGSLNIELTEEQLITESEEEEKIIGFKIKTQKDDSNV